MLDSLIALVSTPLNILLLAGILLNRPRGYRWCLAAGQAMILALLPALLWASSYGTASPVYRDVYGKTAFVEFLAIALMTCGLSLSSRVEATCFLLMFAELLVRIHMGRNADFLDMSDAPAREEHLRVAIDLAWTIILTCSLYHRYGQRPIGERRWQM